jgi:Domain of unknown function (DUF4276)
MKRLIIIVEGQTEKEFVEKSLRNFFASHQIYDVRAIMIQTSKGNKGGFINYEHLKNDLNNILKSENDLIVSMFVDYFRLPTSFPKYQDSLLKGTVDSKIDILLDGIYEDINDVRFIPYIQKHEFESLLFSSDKGFSEWFDDSKIIENLTMIVNQYENPEEINTGVETAPSKRIIKILEEKKQRYDKIAEGNLIAEEIGLDKILEKCPRFRDWILRLIDNCKNS